VELDREHTGMIAAGRERDREAGGKLPA
jgi:hypothetical protein